MAHIALHISLKRQKDKSIPRVEIIRVGDTPSLSRVNKKMFPLCMIHSCNNKREREWIVCADHLPNFTGEPCEHFADMRHCMWCVNTTIVDVDNSANIIDPVAFALMPRDILYTHILSKLEPMIIDKLSNEEMQRREIIRDIYIATNLLDIKTPRTIPKYFTYLRDGKCLHVAAAGDVIVSMPPGANILLIYTAKGMLFIDPSSSSCISLASGIIVLFHLNKCCAPTKRAILLFLREFWQAIMCMDNEADRAIMLVAVPDALTNLGAPDHPIETPLNITVSGIVMKNSRPVLPRLPMER